MPDEYIVNEPDRIEISTSDYALFKHLTTDPEKMRYLFDAKWHLTSVKSIGGPGYFHADLTLLRLIEITKPSENWKPIASAPQSGFKKPRHYVLVRGPSGMVGVEHDIVLAYHDAEYRPLNPWRDVHNDALSDSGLVPTEWMEPPE